MIVFYVRQWNGRRWSRGVRYYTWHEAVQHICSHHGAAVFKITKRMGRPLK